MYDYRRLTPRQKLEVVEQRRRMGFPEHAPPHLHEVSAWFLITAATFEHRPHFSTEADRTWLQKELLRELRTAGIVYTAWVILPNHYHVLAQCSPLKAAAAPLRRIHGRTATALNQQDGAPGRQVWYRYSDRAIRSARHYYTTLNYIHMNPVKHGYVRNPLDWHCSSMHWYVQHFGIEWLRDLWREHPLRDYGKGWDW